ncbi:NAD(P)H-dependent oxidoreductase [Saccharothrix violaceirubra]|uniref:FMN dependent NADH:quinone oxidoreductase n=1 Tax=Saccharothrix violaceirubra TaxID=413306 RepID=A0A7W7T5K8_9PSEU|nr:NAD(P)H-dependent oxidoreductase [Saccharothrix violaceirubra]MBB4966966.1 FMN-dependent NADH-azoreductase [Saccharothrix violaceirubra]
MAQLLRVDASIRRSASVSRAVADTFQRAWSARHPSGVVTVNDLETDPLPYLTVDDVAVNWTPPEGRTPAQHASAATAAGLVDELTAADVLLLAVPLYNWGTPALFKSWVDHVLNESRVAGRRGAFAGLPTVVVSARGGAYGVGAPREGWDHAVPYLRHVLGEQLGFDLHEVLVEFTLSDVDPGLAPFQEDARRSLAEAHVAAERLAKELG